jgi:hypothetical protein
LLVCDLSGKILKHIAPPKDRFWADPFPIEFNDKTYLFVEQQIGSGNGTLGFIELFSDLTTSPFVPILEKPYHLSYPCVTNINNTWYLIPESHENKTIDVYQAIEFPFTWEYLMPLMDNVDANDSTLLFYNNLWWIFTSIATKTNPANKNLSLFFSDSFPSNTWIPHPLNPVCSNLSNSRMAGSCFLKNGILYRPSQDCLKNYGNKTNINRIIELTPSSYKEEIIRTIYPEKEIHAVCTHTINYSSKYMLRDIKTRRLKILT